MDTNSLATDVAEQFLAAYDSHEDRKLKALKRKYGITGPFVLAGLLAWYKRNS